MCRRNNHSQAFRGPGQTRGNNFSEGLLWRPDSGSSDRKVTGFCSSETRLDAERNREFGATLPRTWHRQWLDISMRMILTTG